MKVMKFEALAGVLRRIHLFWNMKYDAMSVGEWLIDVS
jgi:hypothetical protein